MPPGQKRTRTLPITPLADLRRATLWLCVLLTYPALAGQPSKLSSDAAFASDARLVAIGGSITEIVYALGEQNRLVARDSTSVYPADAMRLPDIGYMRQLSPEGVLSVGPEGIIALEGSGPPEAIQVLKRSSVALVTIPERFDREGILDKIRRVGRSLGVEEKASALATEVVTDLDQAVAFARNAGEPKRVLFILSMQDGKILASGTGTAADGMSRLAGGTNAIEGYAGYKPLTQEAIIEARPDAVLMMDRGGEHAPDPDTVFANPALAATPAGASRKLIRMDGAYLLGFGPRTAKAVRDLASALHGPQSSN
ncbi:ABC transporter substrate-binding protein [Pseudaminobacter sp. 19-2017]|uniref:ABC transporter substrate-binding protein n=1 Tax=Pseudaminobacter soli (ex Zhang et al. 2022) TaxID=2831468 RepID=A0A942I2V0_9HYPH|nr:ABC transporter substrate-binding protein [Pseudaminobacter soli]MBS3649308.1 ABC transporter substrate-binding protein [Pseudaminobacter soli]